MRLHKFLAHAGVASRRSAEAMIRDGRVTVNGKVVAAMGVVVDPARDAVRCDGRAVSIPAARSYFLLNKPRGVVSTLSDPHGRPTVRDLLPPGEGRMYPVGRLDWDAEGVMLFTDDGELANRLAHPRYGVERTYHVKVQGRIGEEAAAKIRAGLTLEDGPVTPEKVSLLGRSGEAPSGLSLTIREGRHHEVKRIVQAVGHRVARLRRVSFAGLKAGKLLPGQCRPLTRKEVAGLRREAGMP